ncbi:glycerophosphodiester phosphodiesterase family protein, partial [Gilvimarinus sp. 1_MG-2023]
MRTSTVIAHRGASRMAPENTLAAFRLAQQAGASWIEVDVA